MQIASCKTLKENRYMKKILYAITLTVLAMMLLGMTVTASSIDGFASENGFTVASFNECELKRIVVEKAKTVIMLMDSSKCNRALPYTFCGITGADIIITDSAFPRELVKKVTAQGVRVIIADQIK